jgi:exodeoxyribonuclease III
MKTIRLLSWNVNGLRAIAKKGFSEWFQKEEPDVLCLQETKVHEDDLTFDLKIFPGYLSYFCSGIKRGYSGVATYTKEPALSESSSIENSKFDHEGRILITKFTHFTLLNIYFPNGRMSQERLTYKMEFYQEFLKFINKLKVSEPNLVICGDVNTAHQEIDLFHPDNNNKHSGFLPEERAWIDKFLAAGFVDTFRVFNKEPHHYTWWDQRSRARDRDMGWRIDYFFVSSSLQKNLSKAFILDQVQGSDHCPLGIELTF